ncbi:unnamed protein product, partial [Timema podura]|nr:unnamed protein product [Timema podura]
KRSSLHISETVPVTHPKTSFQWYELRPRQRITKLSSLTDLVPTKTSSRERSLFDLGGGNVLKSLFGILDSEDLSLLQERSTKQPVGSGYASLVEDLLLLQTLQHKTRGLNLKQLDEGMAQNSLSRHTRLIGTRNSG